MISAASALRRMAAERLAEFVGERGGQLPEQGDPAGVGQVAAQFVGFHFRLSLLGDVADHAVGADDRARRRPARQRRTR